MEAESLSSESHHGAAGSSQDVPSAPESEPAELFAADESPEARLRRENSALELAYAIEQQIAVARELPSLVIEILMRLRAWLDCELAAALIQVGPSGQLFAVRAGGACVERTLDADHVQRLMSRARRPIKREVDSGGSVADLLTDLPGLAARDTYSVPLSDARTQIGILQIVNRRPDAESDEELFQRLAVSAVQLGRAIVLQLGREASERAERSALLSAAIDSIVADIRGPLSVVGQCVNQMSAEDASEMRAEHAARADRALEHVERMTQDVLAFARGQREIVMRPVQLPRFVEEVRELLSPELERAACSFEVDVAYAGSARFDESKLKRVLWSLARNACQAGADKFVWRGKRSGEQLLFECADNGRGIPAALQTQLFESFDTNAVTGALGGGLGLAMAKKIVDAHCGRITVSSDGGHGSVFRIELPL